jgi:DNA polymerase-1
VSSTARAEPASPLTALRRLLREVGALGVRFYLSGADVVTEGAETLPSSLRNALRAYADNGLLFSYLGGDKDEDAPLELLEKLEVEAVLVESTADARAAVRQLLRDLRVHGGPLGIDLETTPLPEYRRPPEPVRITKDGRRATDQPDNDDPAGLSPHTAAIALLQLYAGGNSAFVFRGAALSLLLQSHWLGRQRLVAHNASFEVTFLRRYRSRHPAPRPRPARGTFECTLQGAGLVLGTGESSGGGRSLAAASMAFLGLTVPKELQTSDWGARRLSAGQIAYAAADAVLAYRLWPLVQAELRAKDRFNAYRLQCNVIPAVAAMELRGMLLDTEAHAAQCDAWARELAAARQEYHTATGRTPPSAPNEVRSWLRDVLTPKELARWPCTTTGLLSIEGHYLKRLVHIPSTRPVLAILAHEKLLRTFGPKLAGMLNLATGRLHASFNIAAAKTGRFSCTAPNLQQLPSKRAPEFRSCIVAANNHALLSCDYSQIELRAAAWISKDPALTSIYIDGRDLHAEMAALIAGVPLEQVTKPMRQAAKAVSFGSIYGIGARSLAENAFADYGVIMAEAEAQHALDAFFRRFAVLARWRRNNFDRCQAQRQVRIGAGRVVEAAWEYGGKLSFPQCCNLPVQGICADAILRAMALVHARFVAAGIRGGLIATVHDELLCEVQEQDAERARALLQEAMLAAFVQTFPGAPTRGVAEAKVGRDWAEVKD